MVHLKNLWNIPPVLTGAMLVFSLGLLITSSSLRAEDPDSSSQSSEKKQEFVISKPMIPFPGDESEEEFDFNVDLAAVCGNGLLEGGESCDDGNLVPGDGCSERCSAEIVCGDGVMSSGEECDDGNTSDQDGCSSRCLIEKAFCGNGKMEPGEACDDGNKSDDDTCSSSCQVQARCGDGVLSSGEKCDDGNNSDGDGCSASCQEEGCGDGVVQSWEQCESEGQCSDGGTCVNCQCTTSCPAENQCTSDEDCGGGASRLMGNDCVRSTGSCEPSQACPGIKTCQTGQNQERGAWDSISQKTVSGAFTSNAQCTAECEYEVRSCGGSQTAVLVGPNLLIGIY